MYDSKEIMQFKYQSSLTLLRNGKNSKNETSKVTFDWKYFSLRSSPILISIHIFIQMVYRTVIVIIAIIL